MVDISYDELRRIQARERSEPSLVELRPDFYPKIKELLQELNLGLKKNFSIAAAKEYENTIKILRDVVSKREQKILGASLNVARGDYVIKNYLKEEEELLNNIVKILKD
ncbi:DNA replication complex GINS family protein, partial [Candidatus Micrarchaeota archaeon]|nr:DNA replication complex GINS family protein [Candidatus Micrarchaeota archaeon]